MKNKMSHYYNNIYLLLMKIYIYAIFLITSIIRRPAYILTHACGGARSHQPIFSPPRLWRCEVAPAYILTLRTCGGVRGRDSELAGGAIICKDKPPPASAKALALPPEAGGDMIDEPADKTPSPLMLTMLNPSVWREHHRLMKHSCRPSRIRLFRPTPPIRR